MRRQIRHAWLGLALLAIALSACAGSTTSGGTSAAGRTLIVAEDISEAATLDPNQAFETVTVPVDHEVYSNLVTYQGDSTKQVVPEVASSWAISDNNMVYTFQLRKGIKFSNGDPLTASDVVYSLERAVNLRDSPPEYLVGTLGITPANVSELVTAPSPYVVRIQLGTPLSSGAVLAILTYPTTAIVDEKVVKTKGSDWGHAWLNNHSIGSGPYILSQWTPDSEIVLTANPDYTLGPKPSTTKVIFTQVAADTSQFDLLQRDGADIGTGLTTAELSQLSATGKFKTVTIPEVTIVYLALDYQYGPQANPLVQQAIRYAIDYPALVKDVLDGQGVQEESVVPDGLYGHDSVTPYTYDVAKAQSLMDKAGYSKGYSVTLTNGSAALPGEGTPGEVATLIKTDLAQIHINVNIQLLQSSELVSQWRAGKTEMAIVGFSQDYPDPSDFTGAFGAASDGLVASFVHWNSSEATQLAKTSSTLPDGSQRLAALAQFQQYVLTQGPYAVLYQPSEEWAVSTKLSGWYVNNPVMGPELERLQKS